MGLTRLFPRETFVAEVLRHDFRRESRMMMAHDSSPGPNHLADETIGAVRAALLAYAGAVSHGDHLRQALQAMATEARDTAMLPEQLLIVLKGIWYSLPEVQSLQEPADQSQLLQRVVTMCIKEYYSD